MGLERLFDDRDVEFLGREEIWSPEFDGDQISIHEGLASFFDDPDLELAVTEEVCSPEVECEEVSGEAGLEKLFDEEDVEFLLPEEACPDETRDEQIAAELEDVDRFSELAEAVLVEFSDSCAREWEESPFGGIRRAPSSHKRGRMGEALVRNWARGEGLVVDEPEHRGYDCAIEGLKIEVKTSLRWNSGRFVFLQLRDFSYEAIALLGIAPEEVGLWIVPKRVLWECAKEQKKGVSHHGSKWVSFIAGETPDWLAPWGGTLEDAREAVRKMCEEPERWGVDRVVFDYEVDVLSQVSAPLASRF